MATCCHDALRAAATRLTQCLSVSSLARQLARNAAWLLRGLSSLEMVLGLVCMAAGFQLLLPRDATLGAFSVAFLTIGIVMFLFGALTCTVLSRIRVYLLFAMALESLLLLSEMGLLLAIVLAHHPEVMKRIEVERSMESLLSSTADTLSPVRAGALLVTCGVVHVGNLVAMFYVQWALKFAPLLATWREHVSQHRQELGLELGNGHRHGNGNKTIADMKGRLNGHGHGHRRSRNGHSSKRDLLELAIDDASEAGLTPSRASTGPGPGPGPGPGMDEPLSLSRASTATRPSVYRDAAAATAGYDGLDLTGSESGSSSGEEAVFDRSQSSVSRPSRRSKDKDKEGKRLRRSEGGKKKSSSRKKKKKRKSKKKSSSSISSSSSSKKRDRKDKTKEKDMKDTATIGLNTTMLRLKMQVHAKKDAPALPQKTPSPPPLEAAAGARVSLRPGDVGETPSMDKFARCDARSFRVRSVGYKKHKKKAPSIDAMFDFISAIAASTPENVTDVRPRVRLPPPPACAAMLPRDAGFPAMLLLNLQVPTGEPNLFRQKPSGPGCQLIGVFGISPRTVERLRKKEPTPAMQLFARWIKEAPSNTRLKHQLKAAMTIDNLADTSLASMPFVNTFNGKPFMITHSGQLVSNDVIPLRDTTTDPHPRRDVSPFDGCTLLQLGVNTHVWGYKVRRPLYSMLPHSKGLRVRMGMMIEGRADEELPEQILACWTMDMCDLLGSTGDKTLAELLL